MRVSRAGRSQLPGSSQNSGSGSKTQTCQRLVHDLGISIFQPPLGDSWEPARFEIANPSEQLPAFFHMKGRPGK